MNTEILGVVLQIFLLVVISYPLGKYIAKVYKGEKTWSDFMKPVERLIFKVAGVNPNEEMNWKQFLKALLPDPATLGPRTKGKTNIGCIFTGKKDGKEKTAYIYNVCDHEECYREVGSQAISYTTGVPAMIGAAMLLTGKWNKPGVYTVEEFDPNPYMEALNKWGLPWQINDKPVLVD